jgi:hypothetical protein
MSLDKGPKAELVNMAVYFVGDTPLHTCNPRPSMGLKPRSGCMFRDRTAWGVVEFMLLLQEVNLDAVESKG